MMMDSAMRAYANPTILSIAAGINGSDFVPFHEGIFHKAAGEGPAIPCHQDGPSIGPIKGAASKRTMVVVKLTVLTCPLPLANAIQTTDFGCCRVAIENGCYIRAVSFRRFLRK